MLKLSDFHYDLPESFIASHPTQKRTHAKLLCTVRSENALKHQHFYDLPKLLSPGDVLVLNNTKVIPARLVGTRENGGVAEAFLVKKEEGGTWRALLRPGGKIRAGSKLLFHRDGASLEATVLNEAKAHEVERHLKFEETDVESLIQAIGHVPLPPYIKRDDTPQDREDYQTVFASEPGAVAAPTAGLHFDEALLAEIRSAGIQVVSITLHVGYGTFQPVLHEDLSRHHMLEERYEIPDEAAEIINEARRGQKKVIACGTTCVRALESSASQKAELEPQKAATKLFIYPPYPFRVVSGLITNFHLPQSSLLMLVAAFLGSRERLLKIYEEALKNKYRFYSYGDAMLVL